MTHSRGASGASRRARWAPAVAAAVCLLGCSSQRPPQPPGSFSRPTDVAFACVNANGEFDAPATCKIDKATNQTEGTLFAVVPQSAQGEVAAVNLVTRKILDNRRAIPGYSFVPTGELPVAVEIGEQHQARTYVANFGSRDVYVMNTAALLSLTNEEAQLQVVALPGGAGDAATGTPTDMLLLPDESALLVVLPDIGRVVKLPIVRCAGGGDACEGAGTIDESAISTVDLADAVSTLPAYQPPVVPDDEYAVMCGGYDRPPLATDRVTPPVEAGPAPRPVALAIEKSCNPLGMACTGRVLIADEAWPVLHVLDLEALQAGPVADAVRTPIATGTPTRAVVATPRVFASFDPDAPADVPSTRYLYAIDATDGSVMVLENDRLLAVNRDPRGRVDRLPIPSRDVGRVAAAVALEVVTPEFSVDEALSDQRVRDRESERLFEANACVDLRHEELSRRRLRGVFLTIAMADGTVRVVDVYDAEHPVCRGGRNCPDGVVAPDLVRHHPRIVADFFDQDPDARIELETTASQIVFFADNTPYRVRNDGSALTPQAPGLACITCDDELARAFPERDDDEVVVDGGTEDTADCQEGEPNVRVCAAVDPWVATDETYAFDYEGSLPGTFSGNGQIVLPEAADNRTGTLELVSDSVPFCRLGVLGDADIDDVRAGLECDDGVPPPAGDMVLLRSQPLADSVLAASGVSVEQRERCSTLRGLLQEPEPPLVAFEIIAAFEDRLALKSTAVDGQALAGVNTYEELLPCYGDGPLAFDVRTLDSFVVESTQVGFQHQVVADNAGRCRVAPNADPLVIGRAWGGCTFRNDRLQLKLKAPSETGTAGEPGRGLRLQVVLTNTGTTLSLKAEQVALGVARGALVPVQLVYSDINDQLYLVDTHRSGLVPIDLDFFPESPTTSFY